MLATSASYLLRRARQEAGFVGRSRFQRASKRQARPAFNRNRLAGGLGASGSWSCRCRYPPARRDGPKKGPEPKSTARMSFFMTFSPSIKRSRFGERSDRKMRQRGLSFVTFAFLCVNINLRWPPAPGCARANTMARQIEPARHAHLASAAMAIGRPVWAVQRLNAP